MQKIWRHYRKTLSQDLLAGATGAVAGAPQVMGFALIAGVNPLYGLYGAIVATIVAAITGGSTYMTVMPTNSLALVVASTFKQFQGGDVAQQLFLMTFLVGAFQLGFAVLKLGSLTKFVSNAVMTGFITGAGSLIILGQVWHLTGFEGDGSRAILERFWEWLTHPGASDLHTAIIGFSAAIIIYRLHHTRFKSVATLVAIIITTTVVLVLGWDNVAMVRDISEIPTRLPAFALPAFDLISQKLLLATLAMAVLASVQSAAISNTVREPDGSTANATRDLLGQGLGNIAGGFLQSMPSGGSLSRTAINVASGAKTRMANISAGLMIALVVLIFGNLIEQVTLAALAGHLIVAAASLIKRDAIMMVWNVRVAGRVAMVATFISTLVFPLEYSIYIGVGLSLAMYAYSSAETIQVTRLIPMGDHRFREIPLPKQLPHNETTIIWVSGNLYFAAVKRLEELLPSADGVENAIVILRLRGNEYLGSTGIRLLRQYADKLEAKGGKLILSGVGKSIKRQLEKTRAFEQFGHENIFCADDIIFDATERALQYASTLEIHESADPIIESGD
jgi:SulP family sulfate permease